MNPAHIPPEGGDTIVIVGDKARIIADGAMTGGQCTVFEAITPPGVGPPLHRHTHEDEYFHVQEGLVKFSVDGRVFTARPGALVIAPRGSVHTFMNAGPTPSRMLIWVSPSGLEVAFRENARLFERNPHATPAEIEPIFARAGIEFLGPPLSATV